MSYNKLINIKAIEEALSINDIDESTRTLLTRAKKEKSLLTGINIDIYDIQKCSELKEIVNYRMDRLQLENRPLAGAKKCIEKLKSLPQTMPTSWAATHINNEKLIFIINRIDNSIIHVLSFTSKHTTH